MAVRKGGARPMGKRISSAPSLGKQIGSAMKTPLAASRMTTGKMGHSRPSAARPSAVRPPRPSRPAAHHIPRPSSRPSYGYNNPNSGSVLGTLLTAGAGYLMREQMEDTVSETLGRIFGEEETAAAAPVQPVAAQPEAELSELPAKCSHCGAPVSTQICEYCRCNVSE